jgi:hypothetical protein
VVAHHCFPVTVVIGKLAGVWVFCAGSGSLAQLPIESSSAVPGCTEHGITSIA